MAPQFVNEWSMRTALHKSALLVGCQSNLRVAAISVWDEGIGKIRVIPKDCSQCSGFPCRKVVDGVLIGVPA